MVWKLLKRLFGSQEKLPVLGDDSGWSWKDRGAASPSGEWGVDLHGIQGGVTVKQPSGEIRAISGFTRPAEAVIFDDGYLVLADFSEFEELRSLLHVIGPDGRLIRTHALNALPGMLYADHVRGIAILATANSNVEEHSGMLFAVDPRTGEVLWKHPAFCPAAQLALLPEKGEIRVLGHVTEGPEGWFLRLSYDGELLERLPRTGYEAMEFARAELEAGETERAIALFEQALASDISVNTKASAHRAIGEILEAQDPKAALVHYRKAVSFNDRIGLKRKIQKLEKDCPE